MGDHELEAPLLIRAVVAEISGDLTPVLPSIGGSAIASVRVTRVLWQGPETSVAVGEAFEGLVYAHSTTAEEWGFDERWLRGSAPLITGLATNQIREVDVD